MQKKAVAITAPRQSFFGFVALMGITAFIAVSALGTLESGSASLLTLLPLAATARAEMISR